ncbi:MAG TPA: DUF455 family protein [Rhizomicrobium sp.]|jgi:uncharacterized ferritin-like protein (DUF455 family)
MNAPVHPDRDKRSGGRWSTPGLVVELLQLAAIERATAHVQAGWLAKISGLDQKLHFATAVESNMSRAAALRQHASRLLERDGTALRAQRGWIAPLRDLDASSDHAEVCAALAGVTGFLLTRYDDLVSRLDPLCDSRLIATLRGARDVLSAQRDAVASRSGAASFAEALRAAAAADDDTVALDEMLWRPVDRVAVPVRPAGRPRPEAGARAHLRSVSRLEPEDIAAELNDNVMAELAAMELLARCSYEHPDLSWSFHASLAAHVSDEARHAAIFRRLMVSRGIDECDLPQHAANYEFAYEFPECAPGSKHELIWRILILCTVLEALAVDKLPVEIATRDWLGQSDIARALDYIAADELFHTENGLRLTRELCKAEHLDPMLERELVHGRFFGRQRNVRARYLQADPERAAREIEIVDSPDPDGIAFVSRTEVELRRRASFTEEECEQVDRWGYNPRSALPRN